MNKFEELVTHYADFMKENIRCLTEKRTLDWNAVWQDLRRSFFYSTDVVLNNGILYQTSQSYWNDIIRHKVYHNIVRLNRFKQAAYTFKWLCKLRPIYCINIHTHLLQNTEIFANEIFALYAALNYLKIAPSPSLSEEEVNSLIYMGTYRDICPKTLELTFELLEHKYK